MNRFAPSLSGSDLPDNEDETTLGKVLVRFTKPQRRALKQLALDTEKPAETLMHEALVLLLRHYGRDIPTSPRLKDDDLDQS
ncbi:ribbon-helix-helix domain-containing protein [Pelagibacterium halotolerans]|uniref:Antitoxin-like ribbon-helix-helix domain-containing protein n=1 Tax=Pelagibacterium halotolerans (strain DSM 22347 / JCM 15775 / CGMCC 1.7692 / B2) TaxID=1082931 RepID=G4RDV6_PELHB|nr:ribbon-helix-helix domain-containing protein [Pelagibacterium halotolerans]AEQ53868.1 hypothetical protein KKY_3886 [Pelagibacterium halotolerans B2]QJR19988.1 hypothetical protein HKM20_17020 [Pelagibacterium halotolerans]SEA45372.1 hypothetical protein SAMN05428936_10423 [Pelagibacterium halotolerans]